MELSPAQCALAVQVIPVLIVALAIEGRVFGRYRLTRYVVPVMVFVALSGFLYAFSGVDSGLGTAEGVAVIAAIAGLFAQLAFAAIGQYFENVDGERERKRGDGEADR